MSPSVVDIVATAVALLSGCASPNPYAIRAADGGSQGMSKTAKYGGLGALAGARLVQLSVTITVARER